MPKLDQQGVAQLLVVLILLAGIVAGVYLVQQTQIFKPKAGGGGPSRPIVAETGFRFASEFYPFHAYVDREIADSVEFSSDFDAANLFVAKIKFDKDLLKVSKIDISGATIKNWVEHTFDNETGTISLVGGIPNPGIKTTPGTHGSVGTIYFIPLKEGEAKLYLTDDSAIYRNADNANILVVKGQTIIPILSTGQPTTTPSPPTPETYKKTTCQVNIAYKSSEAAPSEITLSAGAFITVPPNLDDKYIIAVQWDYDGDDNWDTEMAYENQGIIKRVYEEAGSHTVKVRVQLSDGEVTDVCSSTFTLNSPSPSATSSSGAGDANNDGKIDLTDVSVLFSYLNKKDSFPKALDMNGDGLVNTFDFSLIKNLLIEKAIIKG